MATVLHAPCAEISLLVRDVRLCQAFCRMSPGSLLNAFLILWMQSGLSCPFAAEVP